MPAKNAPGGGPGYQEVPHRGTARQARGADPPRRDDASGRRTTGAFRRSQHDLAHVARGVALFLILSLLAALVILYVVRFQHSLAQSLSKIIGVCVLVLLTLALAIIISHSPWYAVLIPLTVTALMLTIVYNPPFALLLSLTLSLTTTVALGSNLHHLWWKWAVWRRRCCRCAAFAPAADW